jgi:hypothetical protein
MARIATRIWLDAYRMRLEAAGIHAHIVHLGDATAGAVLVKLATMDGRATLWERAWDGAGRIAWVEAAAGPEAEVDATIARARGRDRDLWVIEVEDRHGRHLLEDDPGRGD